MPAAASVSTAPAQFTLMLLASVSVSFLDSNIVTLYHRSSVSEEVAPLGDGPSDDDFMATTLSSDEEDENDSSSISSKGDPEQAEESAVRRADTVNDLEPSCPDLPQKYIFPGTISQDLFFTWSVGIVSSYSERCFYYS